MNIPLEYTDKNWNWTKKTFAPDIDLYILKREHKDGTSGDSIINFAIDQERLDLAGNCLEDPDFSNQQANFILHCLKKDNYLDCLEKLLQYATPRQFLEKSDEEPGNSAIHIMASRNDPKNNQILEEIINKYPSKKNDLLGQINNNQETPLKIAIDHKNVEAAKLLMAPCSVIFDRNQNLNVLHESIRIQSLNLVQHILASPEFQHLRNEIDHQNDDSPIHIAILEKSQSILKILLDNDQKDMFNQNKQGNTGLHLAIQLKFKLGFDLIIDVMKKKLPQDKIGSILKLQNEEGMTPCFLALKSMENQYTNPFFYEKNSAFYFKGIYECTHELQEHR